MMTRASKNEKDVPAKAKSVTLAPLTFEQALGGLLAVPPKSKAKRNIASKKPARSAAKKAAKKK